MNQDQFEAQRNKEYAIYEQEVGSAIGPKLRILLSHLYIEHLLERYISTKLKTTDGIFGQNGLTFEKKLCLAKSFGEFSQQHIDSIRKLNKLRNDLVHKFQHQATEKEIDEFARTFGKDYQVLKDHGHNKNRDVLLIMCCANLCAKICRLVVDAENEPTQSQ